MKIWHTLAPAAALLLTAVPTLAQTPDSTQEKPRLEMVFVLDTTGSMGGLLDGAKQKIWSIVNNVLKSPNHPSVRVGLVAYRDHGDAYVTKVTPLTADLDKVYGTLMDYRAEGGGDTPEDVRQALADGVHRAGWSLRAPHLAQVLFLVGDAPPHDDYGQEPSTLGTAAQAVRAGLVVNTIECGPAEDTRAAWQSIARHGEGGFFAIAEDGGIQSIPTPYDKPLAALGAKMGQTYVAYGGSAGGRRAKASGAAAMEARVTAAAPASAAADRAVNKAINGNAYDGDLLQGLENGSVRLESVKEDALPDDLRKLPPAARKQEVLRRLAARRAMRTQVLQLSQKRDAYLAAASKKRSGGKLSGFDAAVNAALRKELAPKGIRL